MASKILNGDYAIYGGMDSDDIAVSDVGLKLPNTLGLFDMSGNDYEWCYDFFNADATTDDDLYTNSDGYLVNPSGPSSGIVHVRRGGCWHSRAKYTAVSFRCESEDNASIRLVRTIE